MAWEVKKLGDIKSIKFMRGNGLNKSVLNDDGVHRCILYGDLYTKYTHPIIKKVINKTNFKGKVESKKGDVLIPGTTTADAFGIAIARSINENGILLGGDINILRTNNEELLSDFLSYYINGPAKLELASHATGTNIMHLSNKNIESIKVPIPPISIQKKIIKILDSAFEKTTKAKENSEQSLKNSSELFQSYLNSLHTEKTALGNLVDIRTGKLDSNAAIENGKYPFFTCSRSIFAIDTYAFDCEAILLAGNNAVGDFNVKHYNGKFNAYQRTYVITVNKQNSILYRFLYFQLLKSLLDFKHMSVGAGTKFLKIGMIKDLQISLPSLEEQKIIVSKLDELSEQTKQLESNYSRKLDCLEELKQSILQKAFKGEFTEALS